MSLSSQHFTRKYSANKHNSNIHSGRSEIVPYIEYMAGRSSGRYLASHPSWFPKQKGSQLNRSYPSENRVIADATSSFASAYALSDAFGWKQGLSKSFTRARNFHMVIAASTIIGLSINFTNLDPIKALVYSAVINGIVAVPILIAVMKIANDKEILKDKINGPVSNVIGWVTVVIMGIAVVILLLTWGTSMMVSRSPYSGSEAPAIKFKSCN